MLTFLFPITLFLSAILLFSVQPMVAKVLLPVYGGTPAVWTVCMLFFQIILLGSYGYVWLISFFKKDIVWRLVHTVLLGLSVFMLPLILKPVTMDGLPEWAILYNLLSQLGLPLLIIGASAPLLQFAYSQTFVKGASDPYFLYVSSNLGSLIALLSYPWFIERFIGLTQQFHLWSLGFGAYLILLLFILYGMTYKPREKTLKESVVYSWKEITFWIFLSFVPCSLMLGVTLYISTDIAATPIFWVIPLALYLLSFVMTFTAKPLISHQWIIRNCIFFLVFTVIGFILKVNQVVVWQVILVNLLSFFILALLCHRELYLRRPNTQKLTLFYFCLALGGVLAGLFNGLLAPHLFNAIYEYPLTILLSLLVLPNYKKKGGIWVLITVLMLLVIPYFLPEGYLKQGLSYSQIPPLLALIIIVVWQQNKTTFVSSMGLLFAVLFIPSLQYNDKLLLQTRSFYAVNRVVQKDEIHALISQSTIHGLQIMDRKNALNGAVSYYGPIAPIVESLRKQWNSIAVTIIGLGTGTMVCQFRDNDLIKVVEIDQKVIDIAKNPNLFTYLRDCPPTKIIKNDGRLAIDKLPDASQGLLILDAFNSDAIPVHLMTFEAFSLYKRKISEDGVILVNLSNRHLKLLPVINAMGRSLDLMTFSLKNKGDRKKAEFDSEWALLTSNQDFVGKLNPNWLFVTDSNQFLWTDDYSNIIPLLRWK